MAEMSLSRRPVLIVFARAPLLGTVKRRLAAGIGDVAARRFYLRTTDAVLHQVAPDPRWRTVLAVTPDGWARRRLPWPGSFDRMGQGGGDLGDRMERALMRFGSSPAVLVGSDIPDIGPGHIATAFRALGRYDLVFGPADDGGYWLVGARHGAQARGLFRGVRWSGPHALADTRANATGRRIALVDELADIDDVEDLKRWRARLNYFS